MIKETMLFEIDSNGLLIPLKKREGTHKTAQTKIKYISPELDSDENRSLMLQSLALFREATGLNRGGGGIKIDNTHDFTSVYKALHDYISVLTLGEQVEYEVYT